MKTASAFLLFFAATTAWANDAGSDLITRARVARADGVPQAPVAELRAAVATEAGPTAAGMMIELMRCLLAADRGAEAIAVSEDPRFAETGEVVFWRAQALAQQRDFSRALAAYERAEKLAPALAAEAILGQARMLDALGRSDDAMDAYNRIPADGPRFAEAQLAVAGILIRHGRDEEARRRVTAAEPRTEAGRDLRDYLRARLALNAKDGSTAERILDDFEARDPRLAAGALIGKAELTAAGGDLEGSQAQIERFVREHPGHPMLGDLFAKLDDLRSREKDPPNATLKQWENDDEHPARAAYASFYLARSDERLGRVDRASRNYADFIHEHPEHPLRSEADRRLAQLLLAAKDVPGAARVLAAAVDSPDGAQAARLRFLRGALAYAQGDFPRAVTEFVGAANDDPAASEAALANAALAAVAGGDERRAAEILSALRKESVPTARRIELAQALERARLGGVDALPRLRDLSERGGRAGQRARLAVAEILWQQGDAVGARAEFRRVADSKAAGRTDQQDYFAVYLADDGSSRSVDRVAQAARDFLARNPNSLRESDVRMKWGEVLMRAGDARGARVQFEMAARETNDPARAQAALFLAARAASSSMLPEELDAAIPLLEEVATSKVSHSLAEKARWEQARLQSALGRAEESVKILDRLIAETKDPRLRIAARTKRGDALLATVARNPGARAEAIAGWRQVAADPEALPAERNEALVHAAAASQEAGDIDTALAAYYEVLTAPRDRQPEYFWFYKAGFDAANLLASKERYQEAAAIYEKMAAVPGPRAEEAKARVKRLRLENFIWDN